MIALATSGFEKAHLTPLKHRNEAPPISGIHSKKGEEILMTAVMFSDLKNGVGGIIPEGSQTSPNTTSNQLKNI